ncbi:uncharacterized protein [Procambarus clarkii]|uniref:uncharacterized protein isoform X1 n=2 Tax=Procambarus clarkii TaxID=6728 RepID=UPI0037423123
MSIPGAMGKNTINNQKKKLAKLRKKNAAKLNIESLTVEDLLKQAQEQIDSFQYEKAQTLCQEALKRDPDNVSALETSASLCLEVGNLDGAKHCLGRAITLKPEDGYSKYMSMAQLLEDKASLQCYQKGIELLTKVISGLQQSVKENKKECSKNSSSDVSIKEAETSTEEGESPNDDKKTSVIGATGCKSDPFPSCLSVDPEGRISTLVRQLSTAHCSVAELFMTDLCDEDDAENQCSTSITTAIQVDPSNPEAYQHMASFLLVKQEVQEAKTYITKSIEIWLPKYKEVDEGKAAAGTFDPVEVCPLSYATRLSAARILIEVEDYKHAVDVLEGLTEENDEIVDTWYLLGWTHYLQGGEQANSARYYLRRALKVHAAAPCDDEQLVEHLKELLQELGPETEEETVNDVEIEDVIDRDLSDEEVPEPEEMDTN